MTTLDTDEYGQPVSERYERLGARDDKEGIYVRFEPGFGLNVHIGHRNKVYDSKSYSGQSGPHDFEKCVMGIDGWETLCELVDEYRERKARFANEEK